MNEVISATPTTDETVRSGRPGGVGRTSNGDHDPAHDHVRCDVDMRLDGRVLRGLRNQQALIEAFFELAAATLEIPRAVDVAERAGVSVRSLFQHFSDLDELRAAVVEYKCQQALDHLLAEYESIDVSQPVEQRIEAILRSRSELWAMLRPLRQVYLLRDGADQPAQARGLLDRLREVVRGHLQLCFGRELAVLPIDPELALSSLQVSISSAAWDHLRLVHNYDIETTIAVMRHTVLSVLNCHDHATHASPPGAPVSTGGPTAGGSHQVTAAS